MSLLQMNPADLDRSRSLLVVLALAFLLLALVAVSVVFTHVGYAVWVMFWHCPLICGIA
jgi:nitrate reductase NapE component